MSTRKNTTIRLLTATLFVSASTFATAATAVEAQAPGSEAPKAAAEAIHNTRVHGINSVAPRPTAEYAGSDKAQARAEENHLRLDHGKVNDSADKRMLREASRL